jgi:ABC-type phosphate transport system permease subunit
VKGVTRAERGIVLEFGQSSKIRDLKLSISVIILIKFITACGAYHIKIVSMVAIFAVQRNPQPVEENILVVASHLALIPDAVYGCWREFS